MNVTKDDIVYAHQLIDEAYEIAININNRQRLIEVLISKATICLYQNDNVSSYRFATDAEQLSAELQNKKQRIKALLLMADCQSRRHEMVTVYAR